MLADCEIFCFGRWQLDAQRRMLRAGDTPVTLSGRGFDILALLIAHRDRILSRDEIISHVWRGLAVGEGNLTVQMSTLRRVLAEHGGESLILTVPGRGYRFVGDVAPERPSAVAGVTPPVLAMHSFSAHNALPPARFWPSYSYRLRAWILGSLALILCVVGVTYFRKQQVFAPRLSIAVLPLRNLSADHAQDYLADALTEDLTTDLAHIPGALVIARESVNIFHGRTLAAQDIGRLLRVRYLVEGSFRLEDSHYHVNAQLIDAVTGAQLWASRFDAPQGRFSYVRDAIIGRIASTLDMQLTQIESARSKHDRPDNPDALDLFLRARAVLNLDDSLPTVTNAQKILERALQQEPDFADAAATLGNLLLIKVSKMDDPGEGQDFDEAHSVISHALLISPRNSNALAAKAREFAINRNWVQAASSARAALDVEPSNVIALEVLARCARGQGHADEAAADIENILRLTPNSPLNKSRYSTLGSIRLLQLRVTEAVDDLQQAAAEDEDTRASESMGRVEWNRLFLMAAGAMQGDVDSARSQFLEYAKLWKNRTVWHVAAYMSHSDTLLPGYQSILNGLHAAGMPLVADEHQREAQHVTECSGGDFATTPQSLAGGGTWTTAQLAVHLRSTSTPLIIDIGRGVSVPVGATWMDVTTTKETFVEFAERFAQNYIGRFPTGDIVIMGDGPFGCDAYRTASAMIAHGLPRIIWYRGGEEAWAATKTASSEKRH